MDWETLIHGIKRALATPEPIGSLHGETVYLRRDTRELTIGQLTFSVDNPYIAGTEMHRAARAALGERE